MVVLSFLTGNSSAFFHRALVQNVFFIFRAVSKNRLQPRIRMTLSETTNIVDFHLSYSDSIILDKSVRGLTNYNARQDHAVKSPRTERYLANHTLSRIFPFQSTTATILAATGRQIILRYVERKVSFCEGEFFQVPLTELSSPRQPFVWINRDESRAFIDWFLPTLGLAPPVNSNSFLHRIKDKLREPLLSLYFEP